MKLRSERLAEPLAPEAAAFLDSTKEDAALLREDLLGTLAHAAALEAAGVLGREEADRLRTALVELHAQADELVLDAALEDVHMNVEAWLTQRVGDLAKKIHTGRSRNDQVALDLRLWARRLSLEFGEALAELGRALLALADKHPDAVLPGHTHFQPAQPVLFAHHLGAHVARLVRDLGRLEDAHARLNVSPLGAAALAGTAHPIDPARTARLLGFRAAFDNSLDAVSDRDFVHDLLYAQAVALNHVSSLAEELILYSHPAFGFFEFDDQHATGSSLMPQKKNPDILEVARARAGTLIGAITASLAQTRALPLAYNRDLQEQKRLLLENAPLALGTVRAATGLLRGLRVHPDAMNAQAGAGYMDATDLADYLVRRGVPFREAHAQAARVVRAALGRGVPLAALPLPTFQDVNPAIGPDVYEVLGPAAAVAAKTSPGGTAPGPAAHALEALRHELDEEQAFLRTQRTHLQAVEHRLLAPPSGKVTP